MSEHSGIKAGMHLHDEHAVQAEIIAVDSGGTEEVAVVRLPDGRQLAFPVSLLQVNGKGIVFPGSFSSLYEEDSASASEMASSDREHVIPVMQEELQAGKRLVDTGRGVRLSKRVEEHEETVDLPLAQDELVVERVARDKLLEEGDTPGMREEGDTLIVPVLEEVLLVQKRWRLKEEIRITRRRVEGHSPQTVVLRSEQVSVERFDDASKP